MTISELLGNKLIDTHCHLNERLYDVDRPQVMVAAVKAGVDEVWDLGIDIPSSKIAIGISYRLPKIKVFVGVDPTFLIPGSDLYTASLLRMSDAEYTDHVAGEVEYLRNLVRINPDMVIGIGEIGMDAYYLDKAKAEGKIEQELYDLSKQRQLQLFKAQLQLAQELQLPVNVHTRGCEAECADVVAEFPEVKGIFHSYTGDLATARKVLEMGWYLGINGIFTYKSSGALREMYKQILQAKGVTKLEQPSDLYAAGLVLETDAPYLAPEPTRGERNQPANIPVVWEYLRQWWADLEAV